MKTINAFGIDVLVRFRWECPHCFLDQYGKICRGKGTRRQEGGRKQILERCF